jgi:S-adenosylmethionine/arginine decarboxylase-like enzyme
MAFGYELLLDLYSCKTGVCDDLALCYSFLDAIVKLVGLHKQSPPIIFVSDAEKYPEKAGLSGWVPLIESSVVIHTLSARNFISINVYTCCKIDVEKVQHFVESYFHPEAVENKLVERGIHYPQSSTLQIGTACLSDTADWGE